MRKLISLAAALALLCLFFTYARGTIFYGLSPRDLLLWQQSIPVTPLIILVILTAIVIFFLKRQNKDLCRQTRTLEEKVGRNTREILDSERKLQDIIQSSPMPALVLNKDHKVTHWNRAAEKGTGVKSAEVVGAGFPWKVFYDTPRPSLADLILDGKVEEKAGPGRPKIRKSELVDDGYEMTEFFPGLAGGRWLYVTAAALKNAEGGICGAVETVTDITKSKLAETALRESQSLYQAIFDNNGSAMVIIESDTTISYANAEFCGLVGLPAEKVKGSKWTDYIPSPELERMLDMHRRRREDPGSVPNKYECRIKDGRGGFRSVMLAVTMIPDTKRSVASLADITERKDMEARLIEAKDAAQEAVRAKSAFLAMMSHEIRTPLNAVMGMTELVLGGKLSDEQRRQLRTAHDAGEVLLGVINDILDFSKMEAGKLRLESAEMEPRHEVESVIEITAAVAASKKLELAYHVAGDVPDTVTGDAGRLRQVLLNLLSNAIKFTEAGEVVLCVTAERSEGPGATLKFTVKDTGIGIPESVKDRLFRSFSQADVSTTRRYGGTGLGLAISKRIVELMGGEIGVESVPGSGSTFWFTARLTPSSRKIRSMEPSTALKGLRALVVDDNAVSREITGENLASWSVRYDEAESGTAALSKLRAATAAGDPYSLLILDMQMPGMDGLSLARAVHMDSSMAAARMILLTSLGHEAREEDLRAAGIEKFLVKPVRPSDLYEAILRRRVPAADAPDPEKPAAISRTPDRKLHILLAEDNKVNQEVAVSQLRQLGYAADLAGDGATAVKAFSSSFYDLILMDCHMPGMDGYSAAAEIRRLEAGRTRTPIVAMTANALEGDQNRCLAAGMDDYLPKPVKLTALEAVIKRWTAPVDGAKFAELRETFKDPVPGAFERLVRLFLDDMSRNIDEIKQAGADGDLKAMGTAAHKLRGASGNMGAGRLQTLCARLQDACEAGRTDSSPELEALVEEEASVVRAAIEAVA
jgi:PAS domain S-box-containing protein